ncbi:MAG TPA: hypothetical protein VGO65_03625 [Pseudolysinimonas sp.]|nr:hypothetical protein [Schumannella sp.]HEV7741485.1 hypothetical protein [Pseudolysinimonas sp.]
MTAPSRRTAGLLAAGLALALVAPTTPAFAVAASGPGAAVFTIEDYSPATQRSAIDSVARTDESGLTLLTDAASGQSAIADVSLFNGLAAKAPAMWAATSRYVDLSWATVPGTLRYVVFREGVQVASTMQTSYRDTDVSAGQVVHYRIVAAGPNDTGKTWGLVAIVPSAAPGDRSAMTSQLATEAATLASYTTAAVQYQSFIPQAKIDAPPVGCTYNDPYDYGGDNRGFLASGAPYRTRLQATVGFTGSGTVSYTRTVGTTHVYNSAGTLVDQATASASAMTVARLAGSTATSVDLRWNLDARNPFCSAGSISAAFTMTVTKSGSWSIISGSHKQMPNHEIYIHSNSGGWVTVYRRTYASAYCLINGACPNASMAGYVGTY